jgi:Cu-Zn family superoxide dismutase
MNKILSCLLASVLFLSCSKDEDVPVNQDTYTLPGNQFFPEGIAFQPATASFYTGSTTNGDILQVNVQNGATRLFAGGATQGRSFTTGMKWDDKARLWVCGGPENKIYALSKDGVLLKSWDTKALFNSGFINDCITDFQYMYFTDSRVQKIYRSVVNGDQPGDPQEWLTFTNQQIPYTATGTNANGIEITPDGKYLIVVVSSSGKLYRIHTSTKAITEIQLNTPVTSGDGLVLDRTTLYVSRNATGQIFPVTLDADYTKGVVGAGFGSNLLFNTTMAKVGNYLLVVNGQLNRRPDPANPSIPPPVLPFTVSRVTIP